MGGFPTSSVFFYAVLVSLSEASIEGGGVPHQQLVRELDELRIIDPLQ